VDPDAAGLDQDDERGVDDPIGSAGQEGDVVHVQVW
jgi:hypothetical protein